MHRTTAWLAASCSTRNAPWRLHARLSGRFWDNNGRCLRDPHDLGDEVDMPTRGGLPGTTGARQHRRRVAPDGRRWSRSNRERVGHGRRA